MTGDTPMLDVQDWPAVVLLQPLSEARDAPLGMLNKRLAHRLVADFQDDVLRLVVVEGAPPPAEQESGQPDVIYVTAPPEPSKAGELIAEALNKLAPRYAYTFLDLSRRSPGFTNHMVEQLGAAHLEVQRRLVRIRRTSPPFLENPEQMQVPGWSLLSTVILDRPKPSHPLAQVGEEFLSRLATKAGLREPLANASRPNPQPGTTRDQYPEEVRIHQTWDQASGVKTKPSYQRWGRAITRRRVGVALGGSGAWGFSHAALLHRLDHAGIPVDILASASSGSVIAGYYTALGPKGLDVVLKRGWRMDFAVAGCVFNMASLEFMVALDTGFPKLNAFEVMFYPCTSNLTTMRSDRVVHSTLPWGVRASSTAPGLFASTRTADAVYVDGAVADNVPSALVEWLGARMVIASNAIPAPRGIETPRCATFVDLNPVFRGRELGSSLALMFHDVGDWESQGHIIYDPPQTVYPLIRTFLFNQARSVYKDTLAQPEFRECIHKARAEWERVSAARTGT